MTIQNRPARPHMHETKGIQGPKFLDPVHILGEVLVLELTQIRKIIESTVDGFPVGACVETSLLVSKELPLKVVQGAFCKWPSLNGQVVIEPHAWNITMDGRYYVDLTYKQFDPSAPEIVVIRSDSALQFHLHRIGSNPNS